MSRRSLITSFAATALIASALFATGCKKEEQAKETTPPPAAAPAKETAAPGPQATAAYGFENDIEGWTGTDKAVKTEQTGEQKHRGNRSMRVSGTAGAGTWSFAVSPKVNLEPGKKYKVGGWMLVKEWNKKDMQPLLKVAIKQDGKFVSNAFTSKYDLNKIGEWQQVGTIFETPQGSNLTGVVGLEKGTQDPVTAKVYLDDVKIAPEK
jgi:hypothetical protein